MGVDSWLALCLLAMIAYRTPTVAGEHAGVVDTVVLHMASELPEANKGIVDQVTVRASRKAAIYTLRPPSDGSKCFEKTLLAEKKTIGVVLVTDTNCKNVAGNPNRLMLIYDAVKKMFTTSAGDTFSPYNTTILDDHLDKLVRDVARNHPTKMTNDSNVAVPIWTIILVGVLFGVLMAGNCIFFNKLRVIMKKCHTLDASKKSSSSVRSSDGSRRGSKRSSSVKKEKKASSGPSRSSSRSEKKSTSSSRGKKDKNREKKETSCRSSKSLSTKSCTNQAPTSVRVIAVNPPPPKPKEVNTAPMDEVTTVMTTRASLPDRTMDRVRAPAATVPSPPARLPTVPSPSVSQPTAPKCCTSAPPPSTVSSKRPVVYAQPRPSSMGPPIVPTVSIMGYAPSPFQVLATATSPLPPASTPSIFASAQTAHSTPSLPCVLPPQTVTSTTVAPPATTISSTVPTTVASPTLSQSIVAAVSSPSSTVVPPPVTLVPTVSLSADIPATVTPASPQLNITVPLTVPNNSVPTSPVAVVPPPTVPVSPPNHSSPATIQTCHTMVDRPPISPAYSVASTPRSASPSSSRERAPISKRKQSHL